MNGTDDFFKAVIPAQVENNIKKGFLMLFST